MAKKSKWNEELENLCWNNFLETGEIGFYLLYKDLKREKNEPNNKRNRSKSNKLQRK